ncbi:two-component sensor histidine kinase [Salinivibrio sp. AR647]|jgi:signal transduction histidine kinase|nr:two-component sensor histidine kinase [Salinivibrio sp. AR647]OOE94927.1 two-component sensor histidine kinase [Salinivibrio sp. AR640]
MRGRLVDFIPRYFSKRKLLDILPAWMKSSATHQGLMFGGVALISLVLMALVTFFYVDHELKEQNYDIVKASLDRAKGLESELDDEPIEDEEILAMLASGFVLAGILVSVFSVVLVTVMTRISQKRIKRIETVLNAVAEGDLSARTNVKYTYNDLARISVSLDDMLSRLEGTVAAMSDISVNIAHELKTPISRLRHNLLALRQDAVSISSTPNNAFFVELDRALEDSQRLASIFDALLRIAQIESGARRSRFVMLDLNNVVDTVSEIYADVAEDAQMSLISEKHFLPLMIQGDRELLIQQVANLIENALRYCPPGSQIHLRCGENLKTSQAWLEVEDTGLGIADEHKERVFQRLYRVDKSRADGGLGLGLSLAKAIAGLHYGSITLSDANPGLRVEIAIPIYHL